MNGYTSLTDEFVARFVRGSLPVIDVAGESDASQLEPLLIRKKIGDRLRAALKDLLSCSLDGVPAVGRCSNLVDTKRKCRAGLAKQQNCAHVGNGLAALIVCSLCDSSEALEGVAHNADICGNTECSAMARILMAHCATEEGNPEVAAVHGRYGKALLGELQSDENCHFTRVALALIPNQNSRSLQVDVEVSRHASNL